MMEVAAIDPTRRLVAEPLGFWADHGACVGMDPNIFLPQRGETLEPARRVCRRCPVREACLAHANRTRAVGVWGGTSEKERRTVRRRKLAS